MESREIKFRVWDKDTKEMYYNINLFEEHSRQKAYSIVMQYTGLKDKNDKEIYAGHRVRMWNGNKSFILHNGFQFCIGKAQRPMKAHECWNMEIIGEMYKRKDKS